MNKNWQPAYKGEKRQRCQLIKEKTNETEESAPCLLRPERFA